MGDLAFYLRLSMSDGDLGKDEKDESYSIENQRNLLQTFVENSEDLEGNIREYIDDGYTGTNFNRPGFRQMVEDAKNGIIDTILVKDLSRIGRDYIGVGDYLEQIFPILGIRVIAVNSQYDSNQYIGSTMGLEMSISNLVNTLYSRDISKKMKSTIRTKWNQGVSTGGKVPFGYKKTADKLWEIDKEAAVIVREIFDLALEDYNTAMIVNKLNEEGHPTPGKLKMLRGEKPYWKRKVTDTEWLWNTQSVWLVLKNYAYTGALVQGKTSAIRVCGKERRKSKESDLFITENHHEAIVTHEEYEMAQLVITKQNNKGFRKDAGFSLRSKIRCGNCGLRMDYNGNAVEPVVFCSHAVASGKMSTCEKTRHSAAKIENIVLMALKKQLELFQSLAKELEENEEKSQTGLSAVRRNMEKELEILKAERVRQYEAYAEGVVEREVYLTNKKKLSEKYEKLQSEYEQIKEITTEEDILLKDIKKVEENAEEAKVFKKMTRHIAEVFVEEVAIYDSEKMEIRFVFDDLLAEMAERINKKKTEDIAS